MHITSGDVAGDKLRLSGVGGEVLVWRDLLYDGPRSAEWPSEETLKARALFLEGVTGGGLGWEEVLQVLREQYLKLERAGGYHRVVLWFDACLCDLAMLCHILSCARMKGIAAVDLVYVDAFPGVEPFHGLGQLSPEELSSLQHLRRPVSEEQFALATLVDRAFAARDLSTFRHLAGEKDLPIRGIPAALRRWLEELPDPQTALGKLERLALEAVRSGCRSPKEIFVYAARHDTPPQFWGDSTLWGKINGLARRTPPLLRIEGPAPFLPQWGSEGLQEFIISPA